MAGVAVVLKCNFCTSSAPDGTCRWQNKGVRQMYCKDAIANMERVTKLMLSSNNSGTGTGKTDKCDSK